MDKYSAMNVQATQNENEPIFLNDSGMEKDSNVSDTSTELENCQKQRLN